MAFFRQGPLKSISRVLNIIESQKFPPGPPLKFSGATFGAIKFSGNKILIGILTGSEPDMTIFGHIDDCLGVYSETFQLQKKLTKLAPFFPT